MLPNLVLVYFIAFLGAASITAITRYITIKRSILDVPNSRSSHQQPTPRGGGIAIVLVFLIFIFYLNLIHYIDKSLMFALIGGGIVIACAGLYDDIYSLNAHSRLFVHFLSALWAIICIGALSTLDCGIFKIPLSWLGYFITLIGIIWCINFYNFMDGIDGLAGCEGIFIAVASGLALSIKHAVYLETIFFGLAATIAGFTIWNWPPAKIFLGDVGSGFLGFVFAVLALFTIKQSYLPITFWCVISAIFLFDATFTLLHRIYHKKKWYSAHREHAYQHLIVFGASHKQVTMGIILINSFILLPIALTMLFLPSISFWLFGIIVISSGLLWLWIKSQLVLS